MDCPVKHFKASISIILSYRVSSITHCDTIAIWSWSDLVAGVVESRVQALVPLKIHCVERLVHVKSFQAQSPPVGVVCKLGE
ncbi:hypothetical protein TNCV_2748651 [Trichonephila clavipes]|nr:hypothetical protein TNCV_2748651 [Trichonephila clavipes]